MFLRVPVAQINLYIISRKGWPGPWYILVLKKIEKQLLIHSNDISAFHFDTNINNVVAVSSSYSVYQFERGKRTLVKWDNTKNIEVEFL